MPKQKAPTLIDFARPASNQPIITINLAAAAFLILFLLISAAAGGGLSLLLVLAAAAGVIYSTVLISRRSRNLAIEKVNKRSAWSISLPEKQRSKLNSEVWGIAETMSIPDDQYSDLLLTYIVAEDLALRNVQQEAEQPLIRHAKIGETEFDAILLSQNLITCVDVTFLVSPVLSDEKIEVIRQKMSAAHKIIAGKYPGSSLKLLLFIVFQLDALGEAELRSSLTKDRFASIPINYFEIQLHSFDGLQKVYTMD